MVASTAKNLIIFTLLLHLSRCLLIPEVDKRPLLIGRSSDLSSGSKRLPENLSDTMFAP